MSKSLAKTINESARRKDAVRAAWETAGEEAPGTLVIHTSDGSTQRSHSYETS